MKSMSRKSGNRFSDKDMRKTKKAAYAAFPGVSGSLHPS